MEKIIKQFFEGTVKAVQNVENEVKVFLYWNSCGGTIYEKDIINAGKKISELMKWSDFKWMIRGLDESTIYVKYYSC